MRIPLLALLALTAAVPVAGAQTITLKSGQVIETTGVRVQGNSVLASVQLGASRGQVGYATDTIQRIDFPDPPGMAEAQELLLKGDAKGALVKINPVVGTQLQFRNAKIEGNRWAEAAAIKLQAHAADGDYITAAAFADELAKHSSDPSIAKLGRLYQAMRVVRQGNFKGALALLEPIVTESQSATTLAPAWLAIGDSQLGLKDYASALLAYLRIPVFYPDDKSVAPPALLGAARAYEGIEDYDRAKATLEELIARYPASREAAPAKDDLNRIQRRSTN